MGCVYHVMLRGNGGTDIFFAKADRRRFLGLLAEGVTRFGHRLHGFCLMTNHVHLVVQAGEMPLSRAMQNLAFRCTRFVNARRKRIGHLFHGRYKALPVEAEPYLLELVRYVHLNPVRAGLVADPADWPWSGHRAYLGRDDLPWLTTDWVLGQFSRREAGARAGYRAFVAAGLGEGTRPEFHLGGDDSRLLGEDRFAEEALARTSGRPGAAQAPPEASPRRAPAPEAIVRLVSAAYGLQAGELAGPSRARRLAEARGVIGHLARTSGAADLSELAARFGRDPSNLSRAAGRVELRLAQDPAFARRIDALNNTITQA